MIFSPRVGEEHDDTITSIARDMMADGIHEKDAYHVASAIFAGCEYFISTDIRLLKHKFDKIKMLSPVEFVMSMEEE